MRFEIEADIPDGFEAVAYRKPAMGEWIAASCGARHADTYDMEEPWLILREKPIAYEDFVALAVHGTIVRVEGSGYIRVASQMHERSEIADVIGALQAAADHVDRVNAQKEGAA